MDKKKEAGMKSDEERYDSIIHDLKTHCKMAVTKEMHKERIIEILSKAYPLGWGDVLIEITKKLRAAIDAVE